MARFSAHIRQNGAGTCHSRPVRMSPACSISERYRSTQSSISMKKLFFTKLFIFRMIGWQLAQLFEKIDIAKLDRH